MPEKAQTVPSVPTLRAQEAAHSRHRPDARSQESGGSLAQPAAMINQSPQVRTQLNLAKEIQNSGCVQGLSSLAAQIN